MYVRSGSEIAASRLWRMGMSGARRGEALIGALMNEAFDNRQKRNAGSAFVAVIMLSLFFNGRGSAMSNSQAPCRARIAIN